MAIPTGTGSEVLQRKFVTWSGSSATINLLEVPTLHIYTILSVFLHERENDDEILNMHIVTGGDNYHIMSGVNIAPYETFIWNDKFVMHPTDYLKCGTNASSGFDIWISYIDQDWT